MKEKKPETIKPDLPDIERKQKRAPDEARLQYQPTDDPASSARTRKDAGYEGPRKK